MKAVVFHGVGDIRLEDRPEPTIKDPADAIMRLTASAICGADSPSCAGRSPGWSPAASSAMAAVPRPRCFPPV